MERETPKKVSLSSRAPAASDTGRDLPDNVLQFGFDLRLGPRKDVRIYSPFLAYLEKTTRKRFRIKFTERYEDTVENLGMGVTQFAAIDSLGYVIGREQYGRGIRYLVSGVNREGDARYHAVIFTSPDSDIRDLGDLRGRSFAFGSKMSTQGHLIPRKMMEDAGLALEDLGSYIYTGAHINTMSAVLNGEYDAGCIQDALARRLSLEGRIKILKVSKPYPSSIIAYNSTVPGETIETVRSALLAFEPEGEDAGRLVDWDKTEMPLGFTSVSESEFYTIAILARRYGLLGQ